MCTHVTYTNNNAYCLSSTCTCVVGLLCFSLPRFVSSLLSFLDGLVACKPEIKSYSRAAQLFSMTVLSVPLPSKNLNTGHTYKNQYKSRKKCMYEKKDKVLLFDLLRVIESDKVPALHTRTLRNKQGEKKETD